MYSWQVASENLEIMSQNDSMFVLVYLFYNKENNTLPLLCELSSKFVYSVMNMKA